MLLTQLDKIATRAKADRRTVFTSVAHTLSVEFLIETWGMLNKRGAAGVDRETIEEYGRSLYERITDLHQRLKEGRYRAPLVRQVRIPKGANSFRTLGISTVEDRLVQAATARVLSAIFEPLFLDFSYGYRPKRSAHDALRSLRGHLVCGKVMHIYEADVRSFFDRVNHDWLRQMLRQRIADKTVLRLIDQWLRAGVMADGLVSVREEGVPQGGPVSPVLSNIYLHYVLDLWFEKRVKPALRGYGAVIRFADDFVACFQFEQDCLRFQRALGKRLNRFNLSLAPEKSRRILFGRFARERLERYGKTPQEFEFLGFRHICGTDRNGHFAVVRLPVRSRLRRFRDRVKQWLSAHNHWKVRDQQRQLTRMLRGFYAYYGIPHSTAKLSAVHYDVMRMWRKILLRRSQRAKRKAHWSVLKRKPWFVLPIPACVHSDV